MMSTGDAGGGAEIEYPRGSHHDVYRRSHQLAQMGGRVCGPDRRLCHRGSAVQKIVEKRLDAVIIDYKLSSQKAVSYSGVSLAKELCLRLYGFPIFVLTTYKDDLFDHELFDSYLVFDFARYIAENEERVELNSKLIEQIKKHRAEMENWKEELESLLPRAGESATVDERILELDSKIERSIDGRAAISVPIKQGFVAEKINELISKIDQIIESE